MGRPVGCSRLKPSPGRRPPRPTARRPQPPVDVRRPGFAAAERPHEQPDATSGTSASATSTIVSLWRNRIRQAGKSPVWTITRESQAAEPSTAIRRSAEVFRIETVESRAYATSVVRRGRGRPRQMSSSVGRYSCSSTRGERDRRVQRGQPPHRSVQVLERLLGHDRRDLGAEPAGEVVLVHDQHLAGLRTDSSTVSRSNGISVRRSITSTETPSAASRSATASDERTVEA